MKFRILFILSMLWSLALLGQPKPEMFDFEFALYYLDTKEVAYNKQADKVELYFQYNLTEYVGFTLEAGHESRFFRYIGPNPFSLYRKIDKPEGPIYEPVFSIPVSQSWERRLLVMVPKGDGKLNILNLDVSKDAVPEGNAIFYNLNPKRVGARVLANTSVIEPGKSLLVDLAEMERSRLPMQFASDEGGGEWDVFYSSVVSASRNARPLYMIYQLDAGEGPWRIKSLRSLNQPVVDPGQVELDMVETEEADGTRSEVDDADKYDI